MKSLKNACKKRGITLEELHKRSGINLSYIQKISHDPYTNVSIKMIERIYKATGVTPFEYLEIEQELFKKNKYDINQSMPEEGDKSLFNK